MIYWPSKYILKKCFKPTRKITNENKKVFFKKNWQLNRKKETNSDHDMKKANLKMFENKEKVYIVSSKLKSVKKDKIKFLKWK